MNEMQTQNYWEKAREIRKMLDTIPIPAQMRTKAKVITNKDFEPVVILECDFKRVDFNNLHGLIAYDMQRQRWMESVYIPEDAEESNYIVYAPDDWQLRSFLSVRMESVIDYMNRKDKKPEDKFTANVLVGEWDKDYKQDNLIEVGKVIDWYYAVLTLQFEQTKDANKAVFYFDWSDHKYYPVEDGKDVSDPLKYTLFAYENTCMFKPKIDTAGFLYTLSCIGEIMPKITIKKYNTPFMTTEEFDAAFPGYRELMEKKEGAVNG